MSCIFCEIINKNMNARIISETEKSLAFLDINPVNPGHTLVIPKEHYVNLLEIPHDILEELIVHTKKTAEKIVSTLKATGFNILNANGKSGQQTVFHSHFHIIPRFDNDVINLQFHGRGKNNIDIDQIYQQIQKGMKL